MAASARATSTSSCSAASTASSWINSSPSRELFFLRKRNRNIIVETRDDVPLHDDFHWLTLGQIKRLIQEPHTVNMDTRTVIAAVPLVAGGGEALAAGSPPHPSAGSFGEALIASTLARDEGCQPIEDSAQLAHRDPRLRRNRLPAVRAEQRAGVGARRTRVTAA